MKLTLTNSQEVSRMIKKGIEVMNQSLINKMFRTGYDAIIQARDNADFLNHTNNLRSSFGVAVSMNGSIVKSDFEIRLGGQDGDGLEGYERAKELAKLIAEQYPNTIALILVTGEEYAGLVEIKGKLVLSDFTFDIEGDLRSFLVKN